MAANRGPPTEDYRHGVTIDIGRSESGAATQYHRHELHVPRHVLASFRHPTYGLGCACPRLPGMHNAASAATRKHKITLRLPIQRVSPMLPSVMMQLLIVVPRRETTKAPGHGFPAEGFWAPVGPNQTQPTARWRPVYPPPFQSQLWSSLLTAVPIVRQIRQKSSFWGRCLPSTGPLYNSPDWQ